MRRALTRAGAFAMLVIGCGKSDPAKVATGSGSGATTVADAALALDGAAGSAAVALDVEPTAPPPPPTIKKTPRGDCRTEYAPRPTRDPNPMCKIAGGTFMMGAPDSYKDARPEDRPAHAVTVSPYYLDQFEVTLQQVVHYLNAVKNNECEPQGPNPTLWDSQCFGLSTVTTAEGKVLTGSSDIVLDGGVYRLRSPEVAGWPAPHVKPEGARRYCAWAGKRLPTEAEWEFAARHDPKTKRDLRYPWGDQFDPDRLNCRSESGGCKDRTWRMPVGSFDGTNGLKDGSSPWGVHDLAENQSEMVLGCYGPHKPCSGACIDPVSEDSITCNFIRRGTADGAIPITARFEQDPYDHAGFRCARIER